MHAPVYFKGAYRSDLVIAGPLPVLDTCRERGSVTKPACIRLDRPSEEVSRIIAIIIITIITIHERASERTNAQTIQSSHPHSVPLSERQTKQPFGSSSLTADHPVRYGAALSLRLSTLQTNILKLKEERFQGKARQGPRAY